MCSFFQRIRASCQPFLEGDTELGITRERLSWEDTAKFRGGRQEALGFGLLTPSALRLFAEFTCENHRMTLTSLQRPAGKLKCSHAFSHL